MTTNSTTFISRETNITADWLNDVNSDVFLIKRNVVLYGADSTGVADSTTAIAAAIADASPGIVFFPPGTYKYSSLTLGSGTRLIGSGRNATTLSSSLTTGNTITISGKHECGIESLRLAPAAQMTTGNVVYAINAHNLILRDFLIDDNAYTCILLDGGADQFITHIQNFVIGNCTGNGIEIGSTLVVQDTFISNGVVANTGVDGIASVFASGVYIQNVDIISAANHCLTTFPAAAQYVVALLCTNVLCDTPTGGHGVALFDDGGYVAEVSFSNCWFATCKLSGLMTGANVNGLALSNCRILNNQQHGVRLYAGTKNVSITGCQIFENSMQTNNTYDGILVDANNEYFRFIANDIGPGGVEQELGVANKQRYGISIASGTSTHYVIGGNNLAGNVTGGLLDGGSGTDKHIYGNLSSTTVIPNSFAGTVRATSLTIPAAGAGVELAYDASGGPTGYIACVDRGGGNYKGLNINAASIAIGTVASGTAAVTSIYIDNDQRVDVQSQLRISDVDSFASGSGIEISFDASGTPTGFIACVDRGSGNLRGLNLIASEFNLSTTASGVVGTTAMTIDSSQIVDFTNTPTILDKPIFQFGSGTTAGGAGLTATFGTSYTSGTSYTIIGICPGGYFCSVDTANAGSAVLNARLWSTGGTTDGINIRWMAVGT